MSVATGKVKGRRQLHFDSLDEIVAEVDRLAAGPTRTLGNWSLSQIIEHLTKSQNMSLDGTDYKPPFFIRWLGPFMKNGMLTKGMKPGFKLPEGMGDLVPREDRPIDEVVAEFKSSIERFENEKHADTHPAFGKFSEDDWLQLTLRHAELHLSFAEPEKPGLG